MECFARVGARAASVKPVLAGAEAFGVVVVRGGLGDKLRTNFSGVVDEFVVVFVRGGGPCQ